MFASQSSTDAVHQRNQILKLPRPELIAPWREALLLVESLHSLSKLLHMTYIHREPCSMGKKEKHYQMEKKFTLGLTAHESRKVVLGCESLV